MTLAALSCLLHSENRYFPINVMYCQQKKNDCDRGGFVLAFAPRFYLIRVRTVLMHQNLYSRSPQSG